MLRTDQTREEHEHHHSGDFIRLFPVDNEQQMDEHLKTLTKCFDVLYTDKPNDSSWKSKYFTRWNERELVDAIGQLERETLPKKSRPSSAKSISDHSWIKRASTQTPSDIPRTISLSSGKTSQQILVSTGTVSRPRVEPERSIPGVSASRITEKRTPYTTQEELSSREHHDRPRSSSPKSSSRSNEKSQMVTYAAIIRGTRQHQERLAEQTAHKNIEQVCKKKTMSID